jgi:hypothetical protein
VSVQIKTSSPLRFGVFVQVDGAEFWDTLDLPAIPEQADDLRYVVTSVDRIDSLAYRFYNDQRLWWVIALANGLELLPTQLSAGNELRIHSPRFVTQNLFTGAARRVS